jgi:hypothetical protein
VRSHPFLVCRDDRCDHRIVFPFDHFRNVFTIFWDAAHPHTVPSPYSELRCTTPIKIE